VGNCLGQGLLIFNQFFTLFCNVFHKCPLSFPPNILGQVQGELGYHRKVEMAIYWGPFLLLPPIPVQIMFWILVHVGSQCKTLENFPTLHIETYVKKVQVLYVFLKNEREILCGMKYHLWLTIGSIFIYF
jgi:hypothetical protein